MTGPRILILLCGGLPHLLEEPMIPVTEFACRGALLVLTAAALGAAGPAHAAQVYAVTTGNNLIRFDSSAPGTLAASVPITGLQVGEQVMGIDFRPATGRLYALGSTSRLYQLNLDTGSAAAVGSAGAFTLSGTEFGFDFNPVVDRIRVTSNSDQNLRLNPNDGSLAATDTALTYAAGDANSGANPNLVASAYINSFAGATATTLYGIDSALDTLVIQNPPNNGTLNTVGGLGVDISETASFDVTSGNRALAAFVPSGGSASGLYQVDLTTGAATLLGTIGSGVQVRALSVQEAPVSLLALSSANNLLEFQSTSPAAVTSVGITGLAAGDTLVGIDFRPANGQLYGVAKTAGGVGHVYRINPSTGAATLVSTISVPLVGTTFGVDFNPIVDRLRIVSDADQNLRVIVDTGVAIVDTALTYSGGGSPTIAGAAYTNNFAGATTTTLYTIDSAQDGLYIQNPPNNGTENLVGPLGVDTSDLVGLDITATNHAFAALQVGGVSGLYTLSLTTGAAFPLGSIGAGVTVVDLAAVPAVPVELTLTRLDSNSDVLGPTPNVRTFRAHVVDALGTPLPGVTVQFTVTGANPASGAALTDVNGNADFTTTGTLPGVDTVTATAQGGASPSDSLNVTLFLPPTPSGIVSVVGAASLPPAQRVLVVELVSGRPQHEILYQDTRARIEFRSQFVSAFTVTGKHVTVFGRARLRAPGLPGGQQTVNYRLDITDASAGPGGDAVSLVAVPLAGGAPLFQVSGITSSGNLRVTVAH
jgi:xanthosine utilization system XapX-like protein